MTDSTEKTGDKILKVCEELADFLLNKNEKYGDAALNPCKIFSKLDASNSILIRLDDKLNRIINSEELRKNDIVDLTGYLVLYIISRDWLNFDDLID